MKQLLFLLLFPCLCMAQYTGNAGQKITLGEQTTADGLVFRGVASIDTVTATSKITRANKQDTSAFLLLDTVTNLLWHYKTASNGWIQVGGSAGGVTSVAALTLGTTGTDLSSTVANSTTTPVITLNVPDASATARGVVTTGTQTFGGTKTFSKFNVDNSSNAEITINTNGNLNSTGAYFVFNRKNNTRWTFGLSPYFASNDFEINPKNAFPALIIKDSTGQFEFRTIPVNSGNGTERMRITSTGNVGIGTASPTEKLHVVGNGLFTGNLGIGSATPTTSGTGITFPATQSASTNVNTLDDYEEGTWTPVVNGYITNPTMTYLFQTATYTKVGRLVTFELLVRGARVSGGSGRIYIKGLPFTSAEVYGYSTSVNNSNIPTTLPTVGTVVNSDTGILFYTSTFAHTDVTNWCSDCFIYASGYYHTN